MRIIHFNHFADLSEISKLAKKHLGNVVLENGYVFTNGDEILGYCILEISENVKIDWIYAKKGFGTEFLKRIERVLFGKYDKIILNVSIDPNEKKETVMRRMNFYIKNNYRVADITFRKKYGPLLHMYKTK
jgi:hypothetical protein